MVGLEEDPLQRKVLGLLVSASVVSVSVTIGVAEVSGILRLFPSETSVVVSAGNSVVIVLLCPLTEAKKCLVEAMASSLLASLVF